MKRRIAPAWRLPPWGSSRGWRALPVLLLGALALVLLLAFAEDDDDDDQLAPVATGPLALVPGDTVDDLFRAMVRVEDGICPAEGGTPLLSRPWPDLGSQACVRLSNVAERAGIWRIDFEETYGADYVFSLREGDATRVVLVSGVALEGQRSRRLASVPIVLPAGGAAELRVTVGTPADLEDADPVLRPEEGFDADMIGRAHGFGGLFGASLLLIAFFAAFARLLESVPARRYAWYLAAATLAAASSEGYLLGLAPLRPGLVSSVVGKAMEAAQIAMHLSFVAAFVEETRPGRPIAVLARRLSWIAPAVLALAAAISVAGGGLEGWLRYHELGLELDPLFEDLFGNLPLLLGALVTTAWFAVIAVAAAVLIRTDSRGATLFSLGVGALVLAMLGNSFSEAISEDIGDDHFGIRYVLLFDALLFAGAVVRQAYALRGERDLAVRAEIAATREALALEERLLTARGDAQEARALAARDRSRLAMTGHDLRQPLQSLRLALEEARDAAPELGARLEASLGYLGDVLDRAVVEGRPGEGAAQGGAEPVPLQLVLDNAVRMFGAEAAGKGLGLRAARTGLTVSADPVLLIRMTANLTANAVRYAERGGVLLGARRRGGAAEIEVWDTGPGLSEAQIAALREPYARGAAGEGEGLGLASVEELAAEIGARLEIRSRPGRGSVFVIAGLPLSP